MSPRGGCSGGPRGSDWGGRAVGGDPHKGPALRTLTVCPAGGWGHRHSMSPWAPRPDQGDPQGHLPRVSRPRLLEGRGASREQGPESGLRLPWGQLVGVCGGAGAARGAGETSGGGRRPGARGTSGSLSPPFVKNPTSWRNPSPLHLPLRGSGGAAASPRSRRASESGLAPRRPCARLGTAGGAVRGEEVCYSGAERVPAGPLGRPRGLGLPAEEDARGQRDGENRAERRPLASLRRPQCPGPRPLRLNCLSNRSQSTQVPLFPSFTRQEKLQVLSFF